MNDSKVDTVLDQATDLLMQDRPEDAGAALQSLAGEPLPSSQRGRCFALQVVALEESDRVEDADQLIHEQMSSEGDDFGFVLSAGMTFSDVGADDRADVFLGNLCAIDPDHHVPWHNYAIALGRMERYEEAAAAYRHALENDPDFAPAHLHLAYCLEVLGEPETAIGHYRRYVELEPGDSDAWSRLALAESGAGNFDEAYTAYERAVEAGADAEDVYFNWAVTATKRNDPTTIENALSELERLSPTGWRALLTRAEVLERDGDLEGAWGAFEAALEAAAAGAEAEAESYVAAAALRFAMRHRLEAETAYVVHHIFANEVFSEELLELLRVHEGRSSPEARSFQVVLRDETAEVIYGVLAETEEEAVAIAEAFHERTGAKDYSVGSVLAISDPAEALVGVYWWDIRPGTWNESEQIEPD